MWKNHVCHPGWSTSNLNIRKYNFLLQHTSLLPCQISSTSACKNYSRYLLVFICFWVARNLVIQKPRKLIRKSVRSLALDFGGFGGFGLGLGGFWTLALGALALAFGLEDLAFGLQRLRLWDFDFGRFHDFGLGL